MHVGTVPFLHTYTGDSFNLAFEEERIQFRVFAFQFLRPLPIHKLHQEPVTPRLLNPESEDTSGQLYRRRRRRLHSKPTNGNDSEFRAQLNQLRTTITTRTCTSNPPVSTRNGVSRCAHQSSANFLRKPVQKSKTGEKNSKNHNETFRDRKSQRRSGEASSCF